MSERIIAAAIREKGTLYLARAHHLCGAEYVRSTGKQPFPGGDAQGFVTDNRMRFVSREEAMQIALASGQVVRDPTGGDHRTVFFWMGFTPFCRTCGPLFAMICCPLFMIFRMSLTPGLCLGFENGCLRNITSVVACLLVFRTHWLNLISISRRIFLRDMLMRLSQ